MRQARRSPLIGVRSREMQPTRAKGAGLQQQQASNSRLTFHFDRARGIYLQRARSEGC